jgi:type VI protein secretion system component Hcp
VSEHDEKSEEHVEDLDVPETESEDVKGGVSLNYSKIEFEYKPQKPGGADITDR